MRAQCRRPALEPDRAGDDVCHVTSRESDDQAHRTDWIVGHNGARSLPSA